ncbi:MAG: hypothetical protein KF796_05055 [Ramlibacter sp.]|nr:hypothetical protein [Ramlibacter sp.]
MRRGRALAAGGVVAAAVALAWFLAASDGEAVAAPTAGAAGSNGAGGAASSGAAGGTSSGAGAAGTGPFSPAGLDARQTQLALWRGRYERAEQTYASYRDATRYPHESRPIAEHPDQVRPFAPIQEDNTLRKANGEAAAGIRLRTTQERVFMGGNETVKFTIAATDPRGQPLPLVVTRAQAQSVPESTVPTTLIQTAVDFRDDGTGADDAAGDGVYSARLNPAQQGYAAYAGTIRLLAQVTAGGEQGVAHFDVVYTPEVPATWAGVREALEAGSLNFYLKANVARAGRYVVSARVDDANGTPFALLQFNNEVGTGAQEFRLNLFGALVRDRNPAFPLRLRDVEGFLLIPDKFPDRAMMARQPGVIYRSGQYAASRFSADEWSSEERDRYLAEYGKDAEAALAEVNRLQGR